MKSKKFLMPIKKILKMINECQDQNEIENCKVIVNNYVKSAKKNGIVNVDDIKNRLHEELFKRQEELYLVKIFNDSI